MISGRRKYLAFNFSAFQHSSLKET